MLHRITNHQRAYELRIDMTNANGDTGHAHYSSFSVESESSDYRLHVGSFTGTVGKLHTHSVLHTFDTFVTYW